MGSDFPEFRRAKIQGMDEEDCLRPAEIIFEVTETPDGGYDAKALGYSIFTQGEDWNDLKQMARDAVLCHFDEEKAPRVVRLHRVSEEAIAV